MSDHEINHEHTERNDILFLYNRIDELLFVSQPTERLRIEEVSDADFLEFPYYETSNIRFDASQSIAIYAKELIQMELTMDEIWKATNVLVQARDKARSRLNFYEKCRILRARIRWILDDAYPASPTDDEFEIANWIGAVNYLLSILDAARSDFDGAD